MDNSGLKLDSTEYQCGSTIRGKFWVKIKDPEEITNVWISLNRIEKTYLMVPESNYNSYTKVDEIRYVDKGITESIIIEKIDLFSEPIIKFNSGVDGNKSEYTWNFSLDVPTCPPSIKSVPGNIWYTVNAEAVKKSKYKFNIREEKDIKIIRKWEPVLNNPMIIPIDKLGIKSSFIFETHPFFYDKIYQVQVKVNNTTKHKIKKFIIEILRNGTFICNGIENRDSGMLGSLPCVINTIVKRTVDSGIKDEFDIIFKMPNQGIPTIDNSKLIDINYYLKVSVQTDELFFSSYSSGQYKIQLCN